MQVIQAATRVAADAIGLGKIIGTIEVGKEADLIAVRGDPLADIRSLNDVLMVVRSPARSPAGIWVGERRPRLNGYRP
jgi:imidazolonepropionase-like amidohydrolase